MPDVWVNGARNAVQVIGLKDPLTLAPILDATISAKLIDPANANADVPSSSFSLPLIDNPRAKYGATSPVLTLTHGKNYLLDIQAVKNGAVILWDWIPVVAGKGSGA
jgi:hypothetical protein